jgi:hypothetical protein
MVSACEVGWYSTICVECCRIGRHCVGASETSWKSALLEPEREREAMLSAGRRKTSSLCRDPQLAWERPGGYYLMILITCMEWRGYMF